MRVKNGLNFRVDFAGLWQGNVGLMICQKSDIRVANKKQNQNLASCVDFWQICVLVSGEL
jgi:hypothetical protein